MDFPGTIYTLQKEERSNRIMESLDSGRVRSQGCSLSLSEAETFFNLFDLFSRTVMLCLFLFCLFCFGVFFQ